MSTITATQTNTYVYARHIAAKVAADLKRLQRLYGINSPSDKEIDDYEKEIQMLLNAGYLGAVTYGYKRNGNWVAALQYRAIYGELVGSDPSDIRSMENADSVFFTSFCLIPINGRRLLNKKKRDLATLCRLNVWREMNRNPNEVSGLKIETMRQALWVCNAP